MSNISIFKISRKQTHTHRFLHRNFYFIISLNFASNHSEIETTTTKLFIDLKIIVNCLCHVIKILQKKKTSFCAIIRKSEKLHLNYLFI